MEKLRFLQGNEACAEGALYAGCRFFAGYPITPSTEIAEYMANELPRRKGVFIEMEDEIASTGAIIGASLAGLKTMTATSGPGFSLKQEHIGFACIAEVPCVIVDVMRGGPSTGSPTSPSQADVMQARWGTHGDHPAIVFAPSGVEECFYETVRAFNTAEKLRTPVIILIDEVVAHMRGKIQMPKPGKIRIINRKKPSDPPKEYLPYRAGDDGIPAIANFGNGYTFHVTGLSHDQTGFPTNSSAETGKLIERLSNKVKSDKYDISMYEEYMIEDAETVIISYGSVARSAKSAVKSARGKGKKVGLLKLVTVWPFPGDKIRQLAERVQKLIVPEMNMGQILIEVERAVAGKIEVVPINRVDTVLISPDEILMQL